MERLRSIPAYDHDGASDTGVRVKNRESRRNGDAAGGTVAAVAVIGLIAAAVAMLGYMVTSTG